MLRHSRVCYVQSHWWTTESPRFICITFFTLQHYVTNLEIDTHFANEQNTIDPPSAKS